MGTTTSSHAEHPIHDAPSFRAIPVEALGWALDLAYDDQQSYLSIGNPHSDYAEEWPEVARQKAAYCRAIAKAALIHGEDERWTGLAEDFEASAREYTEQEANRG